MSTPRRLAKLWLLLIGVCLARLISLGLYPLMDTTEARYGEIARIMVETGNWIMPQIDYGVPFWGKPPLSFWASALSIDLFANSEFFMRLPVLLVAVAVLAFLRQLALAMNFTRRQADISVAVVATSIGFLVAAGSVMTDMYLCLAMIMVMAGFWRGWHGETGYIYLMYAGLGIGLLAKGPVIIVLAGLALFPWLLITRGITGMWKPLWQRLKLPTGILLMLVIALPWYWLAERASPGFLEYFLVGEHYYRFVDSGWQGDLYGSAHDRVRGTIWLFWFLVALPWSPLLLYAAVRKPALLLRDEQALFALLWMCSPMLLFTLAGNILPAYVLPGLPAIGLLIVRFVRLSSARRGRYLFVTGPAIFVVACAYAALIAADRYSDKGLLARGVNSADALYYLGERPSSASYYSDGRARLVAEVPQDERFYLAVKNGRKSFRPGENCELRAENHERRLYFCNPEAQP